VQFSELLQRDFQLALADEAPGSNHVGNDIDADALAHHDSLKRVDIKYMFLLTLYPHALNRAMPSNPACLSEDWARISGTPQSAARSNHRKHS
jgi:hypothetical protein